jgi:nucleoid-associated protein YgaU
MLFVALMILGASVVVISDQNAIGRIVSRSVGLLNAATMRDQRPVSPETATPLHQEAAAQPNAAATTGRIEEIKSTSTTSKIANAAVAPEPKAVSQRVVQVNAGDTMHDLAARYLGSVDRTHDLIALNPQIKNPDVLYPGETVYLPSHLDKSEQE